MTTPDTADAVTLFCGAQVSPHIAEVYGFQMRRFADWLQAEYHVKIEKATTAHVLAYKASLADLKPATQACVIATVRAFYRWAKHAGIVKADPAVMVRPRCTIRDQEPSYITTDEMRRLIASVADYACQAAREGLRSTPWPTGGAGGRVQCWRSFPLSLCTGDSPNVSSVHRAALPDLWALRCGMVCKVGQRGRSGMPSHQPDQAVAAVS